MGYQDRDYYRDSYTPQREPMKIVYKIIILNVVLWLANTLITPPQIYEVRDPSTNRTYKIQDSGAITETLSLHHSDVYKPWLYWKFLTCGFAHSSENAWHLIGNMLGLFFLGRYVEERYGAKQFLGFYLAAIVLGNVFWIFCSWMNGTLSPNSPYCLLGASGGVTATVILFAITYPNVTLVLFPIPIPMPAWVFGLLLVGFDMYGAMHGEGLMGDNVAYTVHLSAAAFAAAYYFLNWNFTRLGAFFLGDFQTALHFKASPRIRYHNDERYDEDDAFLYKPRSQNTDMFSGDDSRNYSQREKDARLEAELADEADRILRKISQTGRDSLTRAEERTLQTYSELLQRKKR
ncbi:MAG: rhomboid family intramembrane serine protease [Thermoguttaceae bacterium]|nr:rhomboid family intramembrane serine protease [Thermoguttaceae bacterium]